MRLAIFVKKSAPVEDSSILIHSYSFVINLTIILKETTSFVLIVFATTMAGFYDTFEGYFRLR